MAHWRDGGIGNMPGSDDRPLTDFTLLEKLAALTSLNAGDPAPAMLCGVENWPGIVAKIAQDAFDEIRRLRGVETKLCLTEGHYRDALKLLGEATK